MSFLKNCRSLLIVRKIPVRVYTHANLSRLSINSERMFTWKTKQIFIAFSRETSFNLKIFVSEFRQEIVASHRCMGFFFFFFNVNYCTRRISCHSFSRHDASTRAPFQFLRCVERITRSPACTRATLRPRAESTMELDANPASPFRIKGEKSRGASRRYCVTCRCGSVCGRQRRHDANSGRLYLCHWIIHLHVYRGGRKKRKRRREYARK